jgi:ParB/RepB/Spo0J family partition protein
MPTPRLLPTALLIPPPEALRVAMDDTKIGELRESVKLVGVLFNLLVVPRWRALSEDKWLMAPEDGDLDPQCADGYEIVDGHRRYVVAMMLGIEEVPCTIFENAEDVKFQMMLDANTCREDVTAFEEGLQFLELATNHNWSMDELMRRFGKSEDYINDRVVVVRDDPQVAAAVRDRLIGLGHAKEILKCKDVSWRPVLLEQAAVHGATIGGLREMRRHHEDELRQAQGQLPINASEQFVAGAVLPPDECLWCGRTDDPANLVNVRVHQYHQADLKAALETIGLRALLKPTEQKQ